MLVLRGGAYEHDLWHHKWSGSRPCSDIQQVWSGKLKPPSQLQWEKDRKVTQEISPVKTLHFLNDVYLHNQRFRVFIQIREECETLFCWNPISKTHYWSKHSVWYVLKQVCRRSLSWNIWWKAASSSSSSSPGFRWCTVISPSSHTFPRLIVQDWILMRRVSDLLPFSVTAGDGGSRLLRWRRRRPPPHPPSEGAYKKNRWVRRKKKRGEGLAAGVLAVFSGIHYLARLKIHQRLPPFQHMVHLNFTASCSQPLNLIWGAAWSTVHQGNACAQRHAGAHTVTVTDARRNMDALNRNYKKKEIEWKHSHTQIFLQRIRGAI